MLNKVLSDPLWQYHILYTYTLEKIFSTIVVVVVVVVAVLHLWVLHNIMPRSHCVDGCLNWFFKLIDFFPVSVEFLTLKDFTWHVFCEFQYLSKRIPLCINVVFKSKCHFKTTAQLIFRLRSKIPGILLITICCTLFFRVLYHAKAINMGEVPLFPLRQFVQEKADCFLAHLDPNLKLLRNFNFRLRNSSTSTCLCCRCYQSSKKLSLHTRIIVIIVIADLAVFYVVIFFCVGTRHCHTVRKDTL